MRFICTFFALLLLGGTAHARCDWVVEGKLAVNHEISDMRETFGDGQPLANVQVRVRARARIGIGWGTFNSWGTVWTDENGEFRFTEQKGCGRRQLEVSVKFDNADLELRHQNSTDGTNKVKWYQIVSDRLTDVERNDPEIDLGTLTFGQGEPGNRGQFEPRRHAQIWTIMTAMQDRLEDYGPEYAFGGKLILKYPHNGIAGDGVESSYANPINKIIYIFYGARPNGTVSDHFDIGTLYHEAFHIWAYRHFQGEGCLTWDLVLTHDTHDLAPDTCSAFHEGFAEAAAELLMEEIFGTSVDRPHNRASLNSGGFGLTTFTPLTDLSLVQRQDEGWQSVMRSMTLNDLHDWRFGRFDDTPGRAVREDYAGAARSCDSPRIGLKQILRVFLEHPDRGYPEFLHRDETTLASFTQRAADILIRFNDNHATAIIQAHNPEHTIEPSALLCELLGPIVIDAPLRTIAPRAN